MTTLDRILLTCALAASLAAFGAMGLDKLRAARGGRRVPERLLLGLTAAGGVAGTWLGRALFRHKTRKSSFQWKLWLASAANAAWLWLWWRLR